MVSNHPAPRQHQIYHVLMVALGIRHAAMMAKCESGQSPLTRGRLAAQLSRAASAMSIPAHAGEAQHGGAQLAVVDFDADHGRIILSEAGCIRSSCSYHEASRA